MYAAIHNIITKGLVGALGLDRIQPSVGSHFDTTLIASPLLCGSDQFRADLLAPVFRHHIPPLDETYRMGWIAAIGMRSEADLNEADSLTLWLLS